MSAARGAGSTGPAAESVEAMHECTTTAAVRERVQRWRRAGETVALVPTMGNLHAGHLSLVELAARHARRVVCSVFVNPTQFGPDEDFARYPRTPDEDRRLLREAGVDALFAPDIGQMYPLGPEAATRVSVAGLGAILCGAHRPGHFDGVASAVLRLLSIVQPDAAVFGEKDYQQLLIVRRLVGDLSLPVEVLGAPTSREADGLARSSRNQYLSEAERRRAPALYAALQRIGRALADGAHDLRGLEREAAAELVAAGFEPDYVEIRDAATLAPVDAPGGELIALAAARLGRARLIDNLRLNW